MSKTFTTLRAARALGLAALVGLACAGAAQAQVVQAQALTSAPVAVGAMTSSGVVITTQPANAQVTVTGQVGITTRLARDPDLGNHKVIFMFDFTKVSAKVGKTTYTTQYQESLMKPLAPNYNIELEFPVSATNANLLSQVITASAKFALNVDPATGVITSGTGVMTGTR